MQWHMPRQSRQHVHRVRAMLLRFVVFSGYFVTRTTRYSLRHGLPIARLLEQPPQCDFKPALLCRLLRKALPVPLKLHFEAKTVTFLDQIRSARRIAHLSC